MLYKTVKHIMFYTVTLKQFLLNTQKFNQLFQIQKKSKHLLSW
jgi:hypothetical protein